MSRYICEDVLSEYTRDRLDEALGEDDFMRMPSIDIVRCGECKWYHDSQGCFFSTAKVEEDDFCSYGERVMSDTELREFCSQMIGKFKLLSDLQREMQYETIDTKFTEWELKKLIFALDVLRAIAEERSE